MERVKMFLTWLVVGILAVARCCQKVLPMSRFTGWEFRKAFICEEDDPGKKKEGENDLSLIDIKAAIAKQGITVSDLFSAQDLAANRVVMGLVRDAENTIRKGLESEIIVLKESNKDLQAFKDQRQIGELVSQSKLLVDKDAKTVAYMKKRFATGNLVDLSGNLSDGQRQEKINAAVEQELKLIDDLGIDFKDKKFNDQPGKIKTPFDDDVEKPDMTDPKNNPLIPADE